MGQTVFWDLKMEVIETEKNLPSLSENGRESKTISMYCEVVKCYKEKLKLGKRIEIDWGWYF